MKVVGALLFVGLGCMAWAQTQKGAAAASHPPAASGKQAAGSKGPKGTSAATSAQAKPSEAQVMKLLELMGVQDGLQITVDAMKDQLKTSAEQALREKIAVPTAEQIIAVDRIVDEEFKKLSLDSMIQDLVPVYQRHFTRADVEALIAFYSSPAGKKIIREQPAMLRESMQATATSQRQKMELLLGRMDLRIQQLIGDEQNKVDPDKK